MYIATFMGNNLRIRRGMAGFALAGFLLIRGSLLGQVMTKSEIGLYVNAQMVRVEGGSFNMGCPWSEGENCEDDERPVQKVTLNAFSISKVEVTQRLWQSVMDNNPSYFPSCPECPVEQVSFVDVQQFLERLNHLTGSSYRLPTEAEWEFASRGGGKSSGTKFSGSNDVNQVGWFWDNSQNSTHPVGQKGANELGLFDMSGNVWEWCQDWYGTYTSKPQANPVGSASGTYRVIRGGAWNYHEGGCRNSCRYSFFPDKRGMSLGFRLAHN